MFCLSLLAISTFSFAISTNGVCLGFFSTDIVACFSAVCCSTVPILSLSFSSLSFKSTRGTRRFSSGFPLPCLCFCFCSPLFSSSSSSAFSLYSSFKGPRSRLTCFVIFTSRGCFAELLLSLCIVSIPLPISFEISAVGNVTFVSSCWPTLFTAVSSLMSTNWGTLELPLGFAVACSPHAFLRFFTFSWFTFFVPCVSICCFAVYLLPVSFVLVPLSSFFEFSSFGIDNFVPSCEAALYFLSACTELSPLLLMSDKRTFFPSFLKHFALFHLIFVPFLL